MKFVDTPEAKRASGQKKTNRPALLFAIMAAGFFASAAIAIVVHCYDAASLLTGAALFSGAFHALAVMIGGKVAD